MPTTPMFLHGLDSSIQGTKAQWFARHFPRMRIQDYHGSLEDRLEQLAAHAPGRVLIHDAARPLLSADLIDRVLQGLAEFLAIVKAIEAMDILAPAFLQPLDFFRTDIASR